VKTIEGYHIKLFARQAQILKRRLKKDTQQSRIKLLNRLEVMFKILEKAAKAEEVTAEEAQNWMQITSI